MPEQPRLEIDIASYPEFENVVAEVRLNDALTIVISKEPTDEDYGVTFFGDATFADAPSYAAPSDVNRLTMSEVLAALKLGRSALKA